MQRTRQPWRESHRGRTGSVSYTHLDVYKRQGMDTRASDGSLEHLGILDGIALAGIVGELCLAQLWGIFDGIGRCV